LLLPAFATSFISELMCRYENFIPGRIKSVRDLVPYAATSEKLEWSRDEVAQVVRGIVDHVLAAGERYCEDADFVRDLGLS
jgi:hypothetical protein